MSVQIRAVGGVRVVEMALPRGNALGVESVPRLTQAFDELANAGHPPAVLTGSGSVFCVGLDLLGLYDLQRAQMLAFVRAFENLFLRAYTYPAPLAAAVNGHAIAGGGVLAFACDRRVLSSAATFGLTEAPLGIVFPPAALEISRSAAPAAIHGPLLLQGLRFSAADAHAHGLVHELAPDGPRCVERATAWAAEAAQVPASSWAPLKAELAAATLGCIERGRAEREDRWVESWYSPPARAAIGRMRDQLLARQAAR
jgi:enoyl-CoA hydratase